MKKLVSVVLTLSLLLSSVAVFSITAHAAGNHYEAYRDAVDPNGNWANCTYWAWQYAYEFDGVELPCWGNARYWYDGANGVYPCDQIPSPHSIMCTGDGYYGHVAYVTDYDSATGKVYLMQGGIRGTADGRFEGWADAYPGDLQGYIHLGVSPAVFDNKNYVNVGESITFWYAGLTECSKAVFCFEKNGKLVNTVDSTASRELVTQFEEEGLYSVYSGGYYNGNWYYSDKITVYVFDPYFSCDKTYVKTGEEITFEYSGLYLCEEVKICFEKNGKVYYSGDSTSSRVYKNYFENPGEYYVFARGRVKDYTITTNRIKIIATDYSKMGDPDCDGDITVSDALIALRIAAKLAEETQEILACCDTDGDGVIAVNDALAILRVAAKLADSL